MGSTSSVQGNQSAVSIRSKLSKSFERLEEQIRERAYQIFQRRPAHEGDSLTDWLDAQMQVLAPLELVVKDQKKNIVVEASLKGFSPQEIEVEVGTNDLRVFGLHNQSSTGKKGGVTDSACETTHFYQLLPLPCEVELEGSRATLLKNGKLKITLRKKSGAVR